MLIPTRRRLLPSSCATTLLPQQRPLHTQVEHLDQSPGHVQQPLLVAGQADHALAGKNGLRDKGISPATTRSWGLDQGSLVAEPQFVNPAGRDYRLKAGLAGSTLATDGGRSARALNKRLADTQVNSARHSSHVTSVCISVPYDSR
jgi:hypothetical protein